LIITETSEKFLGQRKYSLEKALKQTVYNILEFPKKTIRINIDKETPEPEGILQNISKILISLY